MTTKYTATPNVQKQTVSYDVKPDAGTSVNKNGLPAGTTYTWATTPSTTTGPGDKAGSVTVTYPDDSKDTVNVTVNVRAQKDEYNPTAIAQEVDNGHVPDPETSVNKTGLPDGTTVTWKTTPDVSTPGSHPGVALVHYPDGTEDEVEVPVRVKEQKETFNPTAKEPNQTVRHNEVPDPEKSINTNDLPKGTKYSWSEQPDTSKPGSKTGKVLITYPDKSTEEVTVTVEVTPQKDEYNPTAIAQEVDNGHVPDPETSVNKTGLPDGTTVTWKTTPDVSTPGSHPGVALVHYPDGTEDEVEVPVRVKEQKETFNPTAKEPNQTVRHNEVPDPEKSINTNDLPKGTKYSWSEQPDTSKPGSKTGKVLITYPDKSTEEVTVTVEVTPQKDEYNPTAIAQEVDNGHVPDPETSVNKTGLPDGTTVTWKTTPDVSTPGSHPGVALVHYPDGTEDEVTVPITVKDSDANGTPETQPEAPDFTGGVNTPDAPTNEIPDYTDPIGSTGVDENGNLIVPPIVEAPDFTGGVNAPDAPISEVPEYTDPIGSTGVDENGNLIIPPSVDIPEFMGGTSTPDAPTHEFSEFNGNIAINGELPEPAQLPKVKLIITKWVDENGNELKPADAKTPKVLGEENEAFEHGEIEGYEFVRTEIDENGEVVTHIFRKVASSGVTQTNDNVKPEQTPDALHVPTNETHAQPEKDEVKQKETQTTLPKTGTANSLGLLSVATSSILFGLGFFILSKKEDEE
ncbi:SIALI-17 repeat-containing surface protein [Streptococcus sp. CL6.35]|uniref:SIALI-17 repeat-containing surface protein n=1 Tax=Streptococcus sp. CL6.35 TaxID=3392240 RepID=UPI003C7C0BBC